MLRYKSKNTTSFFNSTTAADNVITKPMISEHGYGKKRICIKYHNSTTSYGLTTDESASKYSPEIKISYPCYFGALSLNNITSNMPVTVLYNQITTYESNFADYATRSTAYMYSTYNTYYSSTFDEATFTKRTTYFNGNAVSGIYIVDDSYSLKATYIYMTNYASSVINTYNTTQSSNRTSNTDNISVYNELTGVKTSIYTLYKPYFALVSTGYTTINGIRFSIYSDTRVTAYTTFNTSSISVDSIIQSSTKLSGKSIYGSLSYLFSFYCTGKRLTDLGYIKTSLEFLPDRIVPLCSVYSVGTYIASQEVITNTCYKFDYSVSQYDDFNLSSSYSLYNSDGDLYSSKTGTAFGNKSSSYTTSIFSYSLINSNSSDIISLKAVSYKNYSSDLFRVNGKEGILSSFTGPSYAYGTNWIICSLTSMKSGVDVLNTKDFGLLGDDDIYICCRYSCTSTNYGGSPKKEINYAYNNFENRLSSTNEGTFSDKVFYSKSTFTYSEDYYYTEYSNYNSLITETIIFSRSLKQNDPIESTFQYTKITTSATVTVTYCMEIVSNIHEYNINV